MQTRSMKMQQMQSQEIKPESSIRRSARIQSKNNSLKTKTSKLITEKNDNQNYISNTSIINTDIYTVVIDFDDASKEWRKNKIKLTNCIFKYR
jgi:hypothetical protein